MESKHVIRKLTLQQQQLIRNAMATHGQHKHKKTARNANTKKAKLPSDKVH